MNHSPISRQPRPPTPAPSHLRPPAVSTPEAKRAHAWLHTARFLTTAPQLEHLPALEVPEIAAGTVEIVAIAREAGHRSKIAVRATEPGINAKGACIGEMGSRVRAVQAELGEEKVDIVDFSEDLPAFVASALSPARVSDAFLLDEKTKAVRALVPDFQLSLAIGREGQNARLAAKLTGAKIDIQPDSVMED